MHAFLTKPLLSPPPIIPSSLVPAPAHLVHHACLCRPECKGCVTLGEPLSACGIFWERNLQQQTAFAETELTTFLVPHQLVRMMSGRAQISFD
jgi:hypothetical protein